MLGESRAALADADRSIVLLLAIVHGICLRPRRAPLCDLTAERRILGALLLGRARPADVASLTAQDFDEPCHRALFVVAVAVLEVLEGDHLDPGPTLRRRVVHLARRCLTDGEGRAFPAAADAVELLDALPWPASCPRVEIALVAQLGALEREALAYEEALVKLQRFAEERRAR